MEDQQPGSGDLTTEDAAPARRRFFRRRSAAATPPPEVTAKPVAGEAAADEATESPEATGTPKTPQGKKARSARITAAEPESPIAEEPGGEPGAEATASADAPSSDATDDAPATEGSDAGESDAEAVEADEAPAEPVVYVPHRPAGRRLIAATAVASVAVVGAAAYAGAMVQPYLSAQALNEVKLDIARTAAGAISTLWSYTPEDMPSLADRASRYLSNDFAVQYRMYIDAIVEPNKQAKVTNTTQVMGAAVESVAPAGVPDEATAIVYTNSVATSPVTKNIPSLRYLSYRLSMQRHGSDWLITKMTTVTTFDLTPQL